MLQTSRFLGQLGIYEAWELELLAARGVLPVSRDVTHPIAKRLWEMVALQRHAGEWPILYTIYPLPYTIYPLPYTIYPLPYTIYPVPYTIHPLHFTIYPKPHTILHALHTLHHII